MHRNRMASSLIFQKISGEGLTEPPPQTPPPAFSRASPSVQASPSILGRFAPSTRASPSILGRFAPSIRASPSTFDWGPWFGPPQNQFLNPTLAAASRSSKQHQHLSVTLTIAANCILRTRSDKTENVIFIIARFSRDSRRGKGEKQMQGCINLRTRSLATIQHEPHDPRCAASKQHQPQDPVASIKTASTSGPGCAASEPLQRFSAPKNKDDVTMMSRLVTNWGRETWISWLRYKPNISEIEIIYYYYY